MSFGALTLSCSHVQLYVDVINLAMNVVGAKLEQLLCKFDQRLELFTVQYLGLHAEQIKTRMLTPLRFKVYDD